MVCSNALQAKKVLRRYAAADRRCSYCRPPAYFLLPGDTRGPEVSGEIRETALDVYKRTVSKRPIARKNGITDRKCSPATSTSSAASRTKQRPPPRWTYHSVRKYKYHFVSILMMEPVLKIPYTSVYITRIHSHARAPGLKAGDTELSGSTLFAAGFYTATTRGISENSIQVKCCSCAALELVLLRTDGVGLRVHLHCYFRTMPSSCTSILVRGMPVYRYAPPVAAPAVPVLLLLCARGTTRVYVRKFCPR